MDDRAAMRVALGALESNNTMEKLMAAKVLRDRLAQPEPEPVDWQGVAADQAMTIAMMTLESKREWIGLTDHELQVLDFNDPERGRLARAVEAKLKERNT
jgi:hypothetical protein